MVKLLFLCRRRSDITHERYARLLLEGHVPLALRHHPTMQRYAVNIVEESLGAAPPLDSIGALWFDSLADFEERLYDSPEGERIIARDVAQFMGGATGLVVREETVREPPSRPRRPMAKLVLAGADARALRDLSAGRGCVIDHVEHGLGGAAPPYVAVAELYLEDGARLPAALPAAFDGYRVTEYVQR